MTDYPSGHEWNPTDLDREIFENELDNFVPDRIFDAHAHLYRLDQISGDELGENMLTGPAEVNPAVYRRAMDDYIPGRTFDALFFPFPRKSLDRLGANALIAESVASEERSRGQIIVAPEDDPDRIRELVQAPNVVGLKCYQLYSSHTPTGSSPIEDFLTEENMSIADDEGLSVTLHIVRPTALADPINQATIKRYAETYPNARIILAHAARGFNPYHTVRGIDALAGLSNVYFDSSAVADAGAYEAIIATMGHQTLLYGSDFPVCHTRGRPIGLGNTFMWFDSNNLPDYAPHGAKLDLVYSGLESLRALKTAATSLGLTDSQIEDIFYGNAARLYGL